MKIKVTSFLGNGQRLDGGALFGNVPRTLWSKWIAPDDLVRIPLACLSMFIDIGKHKILVETGIGFFFDKKLRHRYGVGGNEHLLLKNLKARGYHENDITDVILSHLHFVQYILMHSKLQIYHPL